MEYRKTLSYSVLLNMRTGVMRSHDLSEDKETLKLSLESQIRGEEPQEQCYGNAALVNSLYQLFPRREGCFNRNRGKKKKEHNM